MFNRTLTIVIICGLVVGYYKSYALFFDFYYSRNNMIEPIQFFDLSRHFKNIMVNQLEDQVTEIRCGAGQEFSLKVKIFNFSPAPLRSGLVPNRDRGQPVNLSYKLRSKNQVVEGKRHLFSTPIPVMAPDAPNPRIVDMKIFCPDRVGTYKLDIQLVQEGVTWQDAFVNANNYIEDLSVIAVKGATPLSQEARLN